MSRITKLDFYLFLVFQNYFSNFQINLKEKGKKGNNLTKNPFSKNQKRLFGSLHIRNVIYQFTKVDWL